MALRLLSSAVGIPIFVGLCVWGAVPFAIAVMVVAGIAAFELVAALRRAGRPVNPLLPMAGVAASAGPLWKGVDIVPVLVPATIVAVVVWEVVVSARAGEQKSASRMANGMLCALYIGMFGTIGWVRQGEGPAGGTAPISEIGTALLLLTALCVWATDSMAYFVGRALGRRKMVPVLSPKKTWEGAAGGLAGGLIAGVGLGVWFLGRWDLGLLIGVAAGTVGQIGDLFESALKRELGVKDFGAIIPGHGGSLDRFDSLMVVSQVVLVIRMLSGV